MLTYRLAGTTEVVGVEPKRTPSACPRAPELAKATAQPQPTAIFANHGEPEGLSVADLRISIERTTGDRTRILSLGRRYCRATQGRFEREPWTRVAAAGEPVRKNRPSRSRPDGPRVVLDENGSTSPSTTRVMASPSRVELPGNQATLHPWPGLLAEGASGRGDRVSAATDVARGRLRCSLPFRLLRQRGDVRGRVDASLMVAMGNDRDRDAAGRARQARPRDALGRPLPYGTPGVEPVSEEPLPPDETLHAACALLRGGRPFAAHEVFEARWKAGPSSERELWQGLAQVCVGLTHAARGNSAGAQRLVERGCDHLLRHAATGSTSYGLDLPSAVDWARRSVEVPPDRVG